MKNKRLLHIFEQQPGIYISGEQISQELGVSRTAIWKQIRKLEAEGYEFEASRRLGYKLISIPDKLIPETLKSQLTTKAFGLSLNMYDSIESTQDIAKKAAEDGHPEGTIFIAEQQTSGRGRMGRDWVSPRGKGIWMSIILRPKIPIQFAPQLTLLTAVALCRSLKRVTELPIGIKWPNDLLIDDKKISGILLESSAEDELIRHIVAGVGINVNLDRDDYPDEMQSKATSLFIASGKRWDRATIIADFLNEYEQLYTLYQEQGFNAIVTIWEAYSGVTRLSRQADYPAGRYCRSSDRLR